MDPNRIYGLFPQIPETTTDAPEVPSEALAETIPAPELLPVPVAKEIIQVSF